MELRSGYKQTIVGVIPEEWDVSTLGEVANVSSGGTPDRKNGTYWNGDIPWITTTQIDFNDINEASEYISYLGLSNSAAKIYDKGTLLMAMYGQGKTRGKVAVLNIAASTNQACAAIQVNQRANRDYIFYNLANRYDEIRTLSNNGNQENLNGNIIKSIPLPIPSITEQHAIAIVLSDVDMLLATLDSLIAKKRDIKQAAMQQLLTGQKRLPGFDGEWEVKRLGDVGVFFKGRGIRKDEVISDGLPCVRYGEIYTHHNDHLRAFNSFITLDTARQSQRIEMGDLLFAGSGETAEEIGKCVAFLWKAEAYAGGDIVILRPNGQSSEFLGYLMNHSSTVAQKSRMGQGDAVVHISARSLARLELDLPPRDEQTAIAEVLMDMDAEISALEQRRDKIRAIKQGMMQELLTGRTRLI